ncbi:hepatitis A virus cellular receptor 1 homolog isoform 2-T2 [Odontesthes bonariensis]|uniref:hepatitis A virus cellular receptor 1 homolog isoform X2 n=1 Tax=Odontesthes bonariensis TaxID=219752 RepID=UPI003F58E8C1
MKTVLLLALLTVAECGVPVVGGAGQSATLPCFYDRKYHGALSFCWVRGQIPSQGCGNQLVSSDGTAGTPASSRYQLLGRLDRGDVSMTILNLTEEDAGAYGCRVEIPGWFNDQKHQFMLTVTGADLTTGTTLATETPAANQTEGLMISTETVMISCGTDATDTAKASAAGLVHVRLSRRAAAASRLGRGERLPDRGRRRLRVLSLSSEAPPTDDRQLL